MAIQPGTFYARKISRSETALAYVLREYQPDADPTAARMTVFWEVVFHKDGAPPSRPFTPTYMMTREFERKYWKVVVT